MRKYEDFEFIIRRGWKTDLDQLVDLAADFYDESNFLGPLRISKENYKKTIAPYIENDNVAAILAVKDGVILGYLHIYWQTDFTIERIGEVYQFYVRPDYRGSGVARALVETAVAQYAKWNCVRGYVEAAPGMDKPEHLKLFENLWGRVGYNKIGIVMMGDFKHGKQETASGPRAD